MNTAIQLKTVPHVRTQLDANGQQTNSVSILTLTINLLHTPVWIALFLVIVILATMNLIVNGVVRLEIVRQRKVPHADNGQPRAMDIALDFQLVMAAIRSKDVVGVVTLQSATLYNQPNACLLTHALGLIKQLAPNVDLMAVRSLAEFSFLLVSHCWPTLVTDFMNGEPEQKVPTLN